MNLHRLLAITAALTAGGCGADVTTASEAGSTAATSGSVTSAAGSGSGGAASASTAANTGTAAGGSSASTATAAGGSSASTGTGAGAAGPIGIWQSDGFAFHLALDATRAYWIFQEIPFGGATTGIKGALKTVGPAMDFVPDVPPCGLAVDAAQLYWSTGNDVLARAITGGPPILLASGQELLIGSVIAVDATHAYWANRYYGTVVGAPIGGGATITVASGQDLPWAVAVDDTHVYWANSGNPGSIASAPKMGGPVVTLASGQATPFRLALDAGSVYWVNLDGGEVARVPKGGGTPSVLAVGALGTNAIAVDATDVYFADGEANGSIKRVSLAGGASPVTLAVDQYPYDLAVDDEAVYWTRNVTSASPDFKVMKLLKK